MMAYDHNEGGMAYNNPARTAAVAKAERWTDRQAWRLNTTPEVILEAVRERAWLPEQIEGVSSRYALEDHPPSLAGVEPWMDRKPKIRRAA